MNRIPTSPTPESVSAEILIVDDIPDNLRLLSDMLTFQGYEVRKAIDGRLALISAQVEPPDLILLDICMPDFNGYEVCERLKSDPRTREIPIVFLSALDEVLDKVKAFSVGGIDYITKPFQVEEVLVRVKTQLTLRHLTRNLEQKVAERTAELTMALHENQKIQLQLVQQEKMAALGQLVAGVAHEINNPLGCISGNLELLSQDIQFLLDYFNIYKENTKNTEEEIENYAKNIELDRLALDIPQSLESMKAGTERIKKLSMSLKTFSRKSEKFKIAVNLHEGIDSTLIILKHRLKANKNRSEIKVVKKYGNLNPLKGYPNQINQVFMNILANSIDAIDHMSLEKSWVEFEPSQPTITIRTDVLPDGSGVEIRIKDNGPGMTEEVRSQIFDYLFTTKDAEKGTGLGLSISRQIVVEKHGGKIECISAPGEGTESIVQLPYKGGRESPVSLDRGNRARL